MHTTLRLLRFCQDNPGELVPEETFIHSYLFWSSIVIYLFPHLLWYMASSLCVWQCFLHKLCPVSKSSLVYLLDWHPALHIPYISSANHCLLIAKCAHTIATCLAVVPRLYHLILVSLTALYLELCLTHPSYHSHLWPLKCHLIFLSYPPGLTSMQHTTSHTTAVQSQGIWEIVLCWAESGKTVVMCVCWAFC